MNELTFGFPSSLEYTKKCIDAELIADYPLMWLCHAVTKGFPCVRLNGCPFPYIRVYISLKPQNDRGGLNCPVLCESTFRMDDE